MLCKTIRHQNPKRYSSHCNLKWHFGGCVDNAVRNRSGQLPQPCSPAETEPFVVDRWLYETQKVLPQFGLIAENEQIALKNTYVSTRRSGSTKKQSQINTITATCLTLLIEDVNNIDGLSWINRFYEPTNNRLSVIAMLACLQTIWWPSWRGALLANN